MLVTPRVIHAEEMDKRVTVLPMPVGPAIPAPCDLAPVVRQCAAMADAPSCSASEAPVPSLRRFRALSRPHVARRHRWQRLAVPHPISHVAPPPCQPTPTCSGAPTTVEKAVQLDVCIMGMDPAAWEQPVTAAWSDLSPKACDGKPKVVSVELASRFYRSIKAQRPANCSPNRGSFC